MVTGLTGNAQTSGWPAGPPWAFRSPSGLSTWFLPHGGLWVVIVRLVAHVPKEREPSRACVAF